MNIKLSNNTDKYYYIITVLLIGIVLILTSIVPVDKLAMAAVLLLSILCLKKVVNNIILTLLFTVILYCNYSIIKMNFCDPNNYIFTTFNNTPIGTLSLQVLTLFLAYIWAFLPNNIKEFDDKKLYYNKNINILIHIGIICIAIFATILGYKSAGIGQRGVYSTIYGYVVLFIALGLFYSNNNKYLKVFYLIISIYYVMKNLMHGERAYVLQMALLLFVYYMPKKWQKKWWLWLLACVMGYIALTYISEARTYGWNFESFCLTMTNCVDRGFALDTACSSFYTSQTFLAVSFNDGMGKRLVMFLSWVASIFVGGSIIPNSNLSSYTRQFYTHWYGGCLPFYGYYYLSIFGTVLFAFYITILINRQNKNLNTSLFNLILINIMYSVFTWYLYSPSALTRGLLLAIILFYSIKLADLILQKIHKKVLLFRKNKKDKNDAHQT